ncbi:AglZ/HisF2 family acetamidino modification protein [Ekhidna sp.]|uniref:AglZ/HisF2 family acetamidino modification protein n=1 Tax=Ekhidna sp. TaxID=2608089 RepID=UPI003C79DB49
MRRVRVIPTLLIRDGKLVKSLKFKKHDYLGDPINTVRIFNDKEADELVLLNISNNRHKQSINYHLIKDIVSEAFMPIAYGGGVRTLEQIGEILNLGVEKIILNTSLINEKLIQDAVAAFGSQSIVASLDINKNLFGASGFYINNGKKKISSDPIQFAKQCEQLGIGEIILHSIQREGTYLGYDCQLIKKVSEAVSIPLVALGGAGSIEDFKAAIDSGASAVAAGSLFVYSGKRKGVLINYPNDELKIKLYEKLK